MGQYRKKPVVIEAFQWTGDEHQIEDPEWACDAIGLGSMAFQNVGTEDVKLLIRTLEGTMTANRGDWIIRGVRGELYPCKPDIFAATYEDVETGIGMAAEPGPADDYSRNMDIGSALRYLREGYKVQRAGWNGKGMWIALMPGLKLPPLTSQEPGAKVNDRTAHYIGSNTSLDSQPYMALWTADGKWQPGWNASTPDLLASDWQIVFPKTDD